MEPPGKKTSGKPIAREVLEAFANLELQLEADAWVCTLSSNWCHWHKEGAFLTMLHG